MEMGVPTSRLARKEQQAPPCSSIEEDGEEATQQPRNDQEFNCVFSRLQHASMVSGMVWLGSLSFFGWTLLLCLTTDHKSAIQQDFYNQVPHEAYSWATVAFITTLALNIISLAFGTRPLDTQICVIACYIQVVAVTHEILSFFRVAPILEGHNSRGAAVLRYVAWAHTTPPMLYALSIMSDLSHMEVWILLAVDVIVMLAGIIFEFTTGYVAFGSAAVSMALFPYVAYNLWGMFGPAIDNAKVSTRMPFKIMQASTTFLWASFPLIWAFSEIGLLRHPVDELLVCFLNYLGKAVFSSSLLHCNYATMEQRRLVSIAVSEEGNRLSVVQELRELVHRKEHYTYTVTQELRTPLTRIVGLSAALLSGSAGKLDAKAAGDINTVNQTGQTLLRLVESLPSHPDARITRLIMKPQKVNLGSLLNEILEIATPLAASGVQLINNLDADIPDVLADGERLMLVLYNLISNACKFTAKGSIWVDAKVIGQTLSISVHDTGSGIKSEKLPFLFGFTENPGSQTAAGRYGGTGLGLCVVKQIVEAHGGHIDCISERHVGSTFTFTVKVWNSKDPKMNILEQEGRCLPPFGPPRPLQVLVPEGAAAVLTPPPAVLAPVATSVALTPAAPSGSAMPSGTALPEKQLTPVQTMAQASPRQADLIGAIGHAVAINRSMSGNAPRNLGEDGLPVIRALSVDDDPLNQKVMAATLKLAGMQVVQAMNGPDAIAMVKQQVPDVMLLDVMMPGMSGVDVCREVRSMGLECDSLPIIMISANHKEEQVVEGLGAGGNDYMFKPFKRKELVARINTHLRIKSIVQRKFDELKGNVAQMPVLLDLQTGSVF